MKKILLLMFSTLSIYSQHGWEWLNPLPTSNTIYNVKYFNDSLGYGVGDFGTVIKTTNAGNNWTLIKNFTSNHFRNLWILDSLHIFAIGQNGSVYKSENAGIAWSKINFNITTTFNDIYFLDSFTGYIVGDQILHTTNAGLNWNIQTGFYHLNSVFFVNSNTGFAAGDDNDFYKTTNAGLNWILAQPNIYSYWYSMHFKDTLNGLLFGSNGRIIKTTNGGNSWIQTSNTNNETYVCNTLYNNVVYVGGGHGSFLKTTDYGYNWITIPSSQNNLTISSININNHSDISTLVSGRAIGSFFDISRTINAGNNWSTQVAGIRKFELRSIKFFNSNTGIVVGRESEFKPTNGIIMKTTNRGLNWLTVFNANYNLNDIQLFPTGIAYACGGNSKILKTTNFGNSWQVSDAYVTYNSNHVSISFVNENTGLVLGHTSVAGALDRALVTTNGGINWNLSFNSTTGICRRIQMVDINNYYIVGTHVYKTSNAGANWVLQNLPTNHKYGLHFFNKDTGLVGGVGPTFRTTNGGINWTIVYSHDGASINNFKFINNHIGYGVGYSYSDTRMIKTTNGGISWQIYQGITANEFTSMEIINEDTMYVVGGAGLIIKTTTGGGNPIGITQNLLESPNIYHLSQNYPNPFNPVTNIKFDVPKSSFVKILIYDILGREVNLLVNQKMNAGSYNVDWDASVYPSGVYFYKLVTDDFVESKKMVLIK